MSILFDQSTGCFHLSNSRVSYIFRLAGGKYPVHVHWGRRVRAVTDELIARRTIWTEETFCLNETVMDFLPMECPTFGGDLREGMIHVFHENGMADVIIMGMLQENQPYMTGNMGGVDTLMVTYMGYTQLMYTVGDTGLNLNYMGAMDMHFEVK